MIIVIIRVNDIGYDVLRLGEYNIIDLFPKCKADGLGQAVDAPMLKSALIITNISDRNLIPKIGHDNNNSSNLNINNGGVKILF